MFARLPSAALLGNGKGGGNRLDIFQEFLDGRNDWRPTLLDDHAAEDPVRVQHDVLPTAPEAERGPRVQNHIGPAVDVHLVTRLDDVLNAGMAVAASRHLGPVIGAQHGAT